MAYGSKAGFWKRFFALLIDMIILNIIMLFVYRFHAPWLLVPDRVPLGYGPLELNLYCVVANFAITWAYFTALESGPWNATLGKLTLGIMVETQSGARPDFGVAAKRNLARFLSALVLCIGYLMAAFRSDKLALHDILAKTRVVVRGS